MSTIFLSGCATFESPYPTKMDPIKSDLRDNQPKSAETKLTASSSDKKGNLYALEQGRLQQLNDHPKLSLQAYAKVINAIQADKMKAKIQASKMFESTGAILTNDREMPFDIPDYAMTFLYAYQSLNYLSEHDLSNALVSIRQLSDAQYWIRQQQDIANQGQQKLNKDYSNQNIQEDKLGLDKSKEIQSMYAQAKNISNSYENGFSYYLASILYMAYGDYNDAMVSIKDASRLLPDNTYVTQTYKEIERGFNGQNALPSGEGRLVVFYEPGFVEPRKAFQLPLFLGKLGFQMVSIPYYTNDNLKLHPFFITVKNNKSKKTLITQQQGQLLVNTTQMAVKSLSEAYPAIITREVLRLVVKSVMAYTAQEKGGGWGLIGASIYNILTSKADQRSWLLLPNNVQLFESPLPVGDYQAKINNISRTLKINNQKTTLLWIVQQGDFKKVFYFQL